MKTDDIYFEYENTEGKPKDEFVKEKHCAAIDAVNALMKRNEEGGIWPEPKHKRQSSTYKGDKYMVSFVIDTGETE